MLTSDRLTLPRGPGSLRQLVQSDTHVVSVNASGASYLVDVSAKKPIVHELPMVIVPGKGSKPDHGLSIEAAAFSPDGKQLAVLRAGIVALKKKPALEVLDVATREIVHRIELSLERPWNVLWRDERIFVCGIPQTYVYSPRGKVLDRIGTTDAFSVSPGGTHFLFKMKDREWWVRPTASAKFIKFEAREAVFASDGKIVITRETKADVDSVFLLDASSGKAKKLVTILRASSFDVNATHAVGIEAAEKKVYAVLIDLKNGRAQKRELQGSPSGTAVTLGKSVGFAQVNWSKTIHRLKF